MRSGAATSRTRLLHLPRHEWNFAERIFIKYIKDLAQFLRNALNIPALSA
jgi:hypothetical protein